MAPMLMAGKQKQFHFGDAVTNDENEMLRHHEQAHSEGHPAVDTQNTLNVATPHRDADDETGHYPDFDPEELARQAFNQSQGLAQDDQDEHGIEDQDEPDAGPSWQDFSQNLDLSGVSFEYDTIPPGHEQAEHLTELGHVDLSAEQHQLMDAVTEHSHPEDNLAIDIKPGDEPARPAKKHGLLSKLGFKKKTTEVDLPAANTEETVDEENSVVEVAPLPVKQTKPSKSQKKKATPADEPEQTNLQVPADLADEMRESRRSRKLTGVAVMVSMSLSMVSIATSVFVVMQNKTAANTQLVTETRNDLIAKIDKVEAETLGSSATLTDQLKELTASLSTLKHKLSTVENQVNDLKTLSDKMTTDTELSLTWAKQTRAMVDDAKTSITANEMAINDVRQKLEETQQAMKRAAAVRQAAVKQAAVEAKKAKAPVTEFMGYKLFSIDNWGDVLLITLTKGDEVKRSQVGDVIEGWRVSSVDQHEMQIVLTKNGETLTLSSSGS